MQTVQLRLVISVMGQQIAEEVTAAANETLGAIVRAVLIRDGLPLTGVRWAVRHQGRPLRAEQTVAEAFPDAPPGQKLVLDVTGEPAPQEGATAPTSLAAPAVIPPMIGRPVPPMASAPPPPPAAVPPGGTSFPGAPQPSYEVPVQGAPRPPLPHEYEGADDLMAAAPDEDFDDVGAAEAARDEEMARRRAAPTVDRHTTVRYYKRMNPERVYPLLVVIAEKAILEVAQAGVAQAQGKRFRVELGSDVDIEPILPGCSCFPQRQTVTVGAGAASATFHVVPHILGSVPDGRVLVRQGGHVLATVELKAKVVKQTLAKVLGLASVASPALRPVLNSALPHWDAQLTARLGEHAGLATDILEFLTPLNLFALLLGLTLLAYLWFRPRRRDVFFDLTPVEPEEAFRHGLREVLAGDDKAGMRTLVGLTQSHPDYQPAWLFCADWYYERGRSKEALPCYDKALSLGKLEARAYLRAAASAGRLGQPAKSLAILKEAQTAHAESKSIGAIWFHMATFAARLGNYDEAMLYLDRATKAGYKKPTSMPGEPPLDGLNARPQTPTGAMA